MGVLRHTRDTLLYERGRALIQAGRLSDGAACLQQAIVADPHWVEPRYRLAWVLNHQNLPDAEAAFRAALAVDPRHAPTCHDFGLRLQMEGRMSEARGLLETALAVAPDHPLAHTSLGNLLVELGEVAAG